MIVKNVLSRYSRCVVLGKLGDGHIGVPCCRPYTVLGIESSCDDSSVALITNDAGGCNVLNTLVLSKLHIHVVKYYTYLINEGAA